MPADLPALPGDLSSLPGDLSSLPGDYDDFLRALKDRIQAAQGRAALSVNRELVRLYWQIGRDITARQAEQGWGQAVIRHLAADLQNAFPGVEGFSPRNLERMRAFSLAYPDEAAFATQPVSQIPWGHNIVLFQKLKDPALRLWYADQTLQYGWSRNVLVHQIETGLHARQGRATTNFAHTLPAPQSDLARQLLKDPYSFDFLTLGPDARERDLERGLLERLRDLLLELGAGFAFVGSQYPLEVGGDDFYLDLLFYHLHLHCYVVVDLKMGAFTPGDAGQMNFYLSAVDDLVRRPPDGPTLGIILCRTQNRTVAQYALRDLSKPLGVAEYRLPAPLQDALPALETLERALASLGDGTDALDA